jgi:competence protein ComEA
MRVRARPDGSPAAERLTGALPRDAVGWVLPPAEEPPVLAVGSAPEQSAPEESAPEESAREEPTSEGEDGPEARSWSPGRHRPAVGAAGPWRLDLTRRGALALALVASLAALAAAGVSLRNRPQEVVVPELEAAGVPLPGASASPEPPAQVVVAVAGKVRSPGLVRLPSGSRVDDAVRAAGGPLDESSLGLLNLARVLVDGEQVLVGVDPPPGAEAPAAGGAGPAGSGLLDLNTASATDLDALPGIGPVLAERIVEWRTANGPFASVDQLREVSGIGEAKFQDLRAKVTVR